MPANSKIFLDTTIQIERCRSKNRDELERIISQYNSSLSSTYVKMEFARRHVRDCIFLHNVIVESDNIAEVFDRINHLHSEFRKRQIHGIWETIALFFHESKDEKLNNPIGTGINKKMKLFLRSTIRDSWDEFDSRVDEILNETDCFHSKAGPTLEGDKISYTMKKCKKENIKCEIIEFFIQNRESFNKIYKKLSKMDNLDDEQRKIKNVLEKALIQPEVMADEENCWNCGDAIIAVESPGDAVIFTTNKKHFEPLCSEIDKKYISP